MGQTPFEYRTVELSEEEIAEEREVYGGLAASLRRLNDVSLRTTVDADEVREVSALVDELAERLGKSAIEGSFGISFTRHGSVRGYGNAVVGLRNPIAVPLDIEWPEKGRTRAEFELNALYEGPPGMVHGGVAALVLDQVMGEAPASGGTPGMTGVLTLRYRRPTPLGHCSAEAWIDRRDGVKTIVKGVLRNAEGETTVEAEGVFILPRWAREKLAEQQPPRYE